MYNPCFCGCTLQQSTKLISLIDIGIFSVFLVITLLAVSQIDDAIGSTQMNPNSATGIVVFLIALIVANLLFCIGFIFLGFLLRKGSVNRDPKGCKIWLIFASVFFVFDAISLGLVFNILSFSSVLLNVVHLIYRILTIWVVYQFIQDMKEDRTPIVQRSTL